MATNKPVSGEAQSAAGTKLKWDDTNMKSSYANVCNVTSTREEVVMLFGVNQAWNRGQKEVTIQLTDRIIISPYAAKRLSMLSARGCLGIREAFRHAQRRSRRRRNRQVMPVSRSLAREAHKPWPDLNYMNTTRVCAWLTASPHTYRTRRGSSLPRRRRPRSFAAAGSSSRQTSSAVYPMAWSCLQKPGATSFAPVAFFPEESPRRSHLANISERVLAEGRGVVEPVETDDPNAIGPRYQLAYPVRTDGQVRGVVGVDIDWRNEAQLQSAMRDLQWGSAWLELFLRRHADPMETSRLRLKLALELVSTLLEQEGLKEGTAGFATELASRLGCDRVTVGLLKRRRIRVTAVSHSAQFDRRSNLLRAVETAMEEATDQAEPVVYPPDRDTSPVVAHAHEMLVRESGAGSAVSYPLMSGEEVVGALSLERPPGKRFDLPTLELCEAVAAVAGPIIDLKHRNERNLLVHAGGSTVSLWKKIFGPGHPGLKLVTIVAAAVLRFSGGRRGRLPGLGQHHCGRRGATRGQRAVQRLHRGGAIACRGRRSSGRADRGAR